MNLSVIRICCLLAWVFPVATTMGQVSRLDVSGRSYVRLRDWASAEKFQSRQLNRNHQLELTGQNNRLAFVADSATVEVNGVNVWLSYPVAFRDDALYASELDVRTTLQPLVAPLKKSAGKKIQTIVLDPGHGGEDTGNQVGREYEKKYTLLLAQEVRQQLKAAGFVVKMTRTADKTINVRDRPAIVNRTGADLFLCLHFNASPVARNEVRGSEVYALTPVGASSTNSKGVGADSGTFSGNRFNSQNILLAYQMQKCLTSKLGTTDRGVRRARYLVLREANMPAVLLEGGYMSHPLEGRKIFDATYRRLMARAIVNGILSYRNAVGR